MSDDELSNYTTAQKFIYGLTFAAGYILVILISIIQGPVFPPVAEAKGLTAAEYGIVFGIFFLTMFFACLFLGKYISFIGVKVKNHLTSLCSATRLSGQHLSSY